MPAHVVDDDGHVFVMATVRQLVDADVREPLEHVGALPPHDDALDNRADRRPRDTHHVLTVVLSQRWARYPT